jgi:hypothetical protein
MKRIMVRIKFGSIAMTAKEDLSNTKHIILAQTQHVRVIPSANNVNSS